MAFIDKQESKLVPSLKGDAHVTPGEVVADDDRCTGCNLCVQACPSKALELLGKNQVRMVQADLVPCFSCGACVAICEPAALRLSQPLTYQGFFRFLHRGPLSYPRRF